MIDRAARNSALDLLHLLYAKGVKNFTFEDDWPVSKDGAIGSVGSRLWCFYSDTSPQLLAIEKFSDDQAAIVHRCVLFLKHDFEYEWGDFDFTDSGINFWRSLFRSNRIKDWESYVSRGQIEFWPFIRENDHRNALTSAKYR